MSEFDPMKDLNLLSLSDEVIVQILYFVTGGTDLINLSLTCTRLSRLARDKSLDKLCFRRNVNFSLESLKLFLKPPKTCDKIKILNLNGVYWIQPSLLLAQIIRMKNLTDLHVCDIFFNLNQFKSLVSKLESLKKLSFSWSWSAPYEGWIGYLCREADSPAKIMEEISMKLKNLTHLRMYVPHNKLDLDAGVFIKQILTYCEKMKEFVLFTDITQEINQLTSSIDGFGSFCSLSNWTSENPHFGWKDLKTLVWNIQNDRARDEVTDKIVKDFMEHPLVDKTTTRSYPGPYREPFVWKRDIDTGRIVLFSNSRRANIFSLEKYCNVDEPRTLLLNLSEHSEISFSSLDARNCHEVLEELFTLSGEHCLSKLKEINVHHMYVKACSSLPLKRFKGIGGVDKNQLRNLAKLSLPICGYLEYVRGKPSMELEVKSSFEAKGFSKILPEMKNLVHVEVKFCENSKYNEYGGEVIDALSAATSLQTFVISGVTVQMNPSKPLFANLFSGCPFLSHLHISSINTDPHKLFTGLGAGLKDAKELKILKIYQKQFTQYSERFLAAISENCQKIEQIVIFDPSKAVNLHWFPVQALIDVANLRTLKFLFIGSELLTEANVDLLKRKMKEVVQIKPYFVSRFQSKVERLGMQGSMIGLPMEYQRNVGTLQLLEERNRNQLHPSKVSSGIKVGASQNLSYSKFSLSDVAAIDLNHYF